MDCGIIKPTPISGFPEFLPAEEILFQKMRDEIRQGYESFGFIPIETPAVELAQTLTAKGADHEIYALRRLSAVSGDEETKNLALHFDLTVPLARYVAQYYGQLSFPFRRYQIQPVWRGERPQAGRFRQFYQCDIDTIGNGELSLYHDAEMPAVIDRIFTRLNIGVFTIRINNRKILQGLFESMGLENTIEEALRIIDRLEKVGMEETGIGLAELGLDMEKVGQLMAFFNQKRTTEEWFAYFRSLDLNDTFDQGVEELSKVISLVRVMGVPEDHFQVDPTIARGLNYYTGTVYETRLNDHPEIGSICSGGRYENLASHFTERKLPGVGISIGLTRLFTSLLKAGVIRPGTVATASVLVTMQNPSRATDYLALGAELRRNGFKTEVFLEEKRLGDQLRYASRNGFRFAIIIGDTEFTYETVIVKELASGTQHVLKRRDVGDFLYNSLK
ncbi:MAG: histidine--tRNA ligase [Magnetococcales bacterium]|nr:histidine--tRNA ligase [Magnetococcales bacterium]